MLQDLKEQLSAAAEHIYKVTVEKDEAIHQVREGPFYCIEFRWWELKMNAAGCLSW